MISRGIVHRGRVVPGTDRVIRDSSAWWLRGRETRPRAGAIDLLVGHWTAGPHRMGPAAGCKLFSAMEARRSADGERDLSVSVHFGISWDGFVWQHLDLAEGAVHVGHRPTIARSAGVEVMWCGTSRQARKLGIVHTPQLRTVRGQRLEVCPLSDEAREAWVWLAGVLSSPEIEAWSDGEIAIPRRTLGPDDVLTPRFAGCGEHYHVPGTTKIDAAGVLCDALRDRGWK